MAVEINRLDERQKGGGGWLVGWGGGETPGVTDRPGVKVFTGAASTQLTGVFWRHQMGSDDTGAGGLTRRPARPPGTPSLPLSNGDTEQGEVPRYPASSLMALPASDRDNILLLVLLYFLQGVPFGLIAGSLPFLFKQYLSFSELALFSLASYPYSLKLAWSPIVDAFFIPRFGRRKTWIVPAQCILGALLFATSFTVEQVLDTHTADVNTLTLLFFLTILMAATQVLCLIAAQAAL